MIKQRGFTLVEIIVVMALITILTGLAVINLFSAQTEVVSSASTNALISDLRSQQIKAMMGDDDGGSTAQPYGIVIEPDSYTLFAGSSFSPADPNNFVVDVEQGLTLSSTLPSNTIIFSKASGEITGFSASNNTITFTNTSGTQTVLSLNRYGVANVQ
jgi:prepilin-type N-terminal cleavage/methylation domain-containing protein